MFSKRFLPVVIVLVLSGLLITFNSSGIGNPPDKYQLIFQQVADMLEAAHYSPKKVDDVFSQNIHKKYLEALDPDKNIFLQADLKELKKFETTIDDELHGAPIAYFYAVDQIYTKRTKEVAAYYPELLQNPFQFTIDETIVLEPEKLDYSKNEAARKDAWRKRLKFLTLERLSDLMDQRNTLKKGDSAYKSDAELEKDARAKVKLMMTRNFDRIIIKTKPDERFDMLVNVITNFMDPHTTFFPPLEKRSFDEQMSGRFYGIGASLRNDEGGAIRIATIVAGLPASKSQQLAVGDQVLKVGQAAEEPTDLTGFETEDAVKLIRGKKGTEVRLTIKKADGTIKIVSMIREEVELDETYDLRNNGGGSLYDVVQMVGFFIPEGPIVQVKDREGNPQVLRDRDRSVLYDGPLAVMVNEFSASASEIFAAAIQDYGRGVVIGSTSTYGKGTVQRNIGLEPNTGLFNKEATDIGAIKESSILMEAANQRVYSLQLNKYREGQKSLRDSFKKIDEMNKATKVMEVKMLDLDQKKLAADNDKLERRKQWIGNLSKDIYINETCQVISDMIRQVVLVKGN